MATKNTMTKEDLRAKKKNESDAVVYKVMIALIILCGAAMGLRALRGYYATTDGFIALYDLTPVIAIAGLALAAVCGVLLAVCKNKVVRLVMPWAITLSLLAAATGWIMRESGAADFTFLYFLCFAVLVQYIILQLYRWEFFLFSLSTVTAGGLFYCFSRGMYFTGRNIVMLVALLLVLAGTAWCTLKAFRSNGWLVFGPVKIHLLNAKSLPILTLAVDVLWLICTLAVLILGTVGGMGGLFAYYCMFAAIAVEFIAAVYYTFQLN